MNSNLKQHLISAGITFITAFCVAILPSIDSLTMSSFENGAIFAILFAGLRAGIKGLITLFVADKISQ